MGRRHVSVRPSIHGAKAERHTRLKRIKHLGESFTNPSPTSKSSFQINGFGGAKLVRAEEMDQLGIIPVDQSVYFLNADFFQMIHKFIDQLLADTLMLV
jgi:hypothetical protein